MAEHMLVFNVDLSLQYMWLLRADYYTIIDYRLQLRKGQGQYCDAILFWHHKRVPERDGS